MYYGSHIEHSENFEIYAVYSLIYPPLQSCAATEHEQPWYRSERLLMSAISTQSGFLKKDNQSVGEATDLRKSPA